MPKGKVPKHIRMIVSISLLILLISPIFKFSGDFEKVVSSAETDSPPHYVELEEIQRKQRIELAEKNFSASVSDILNKNGITPKSVHIYISEQDEEIMLYGISISLSETTTAAKKNKTERIITEIFGIEPSIKLER